MHGPCATPSSVTPLPEHPQTLRCPLPHDTLLEACMAAVMVDHLLQSPSWGMSGPHNTLPTVATDPVTPTSCSALPGTLMDPMIPCSQQHCSWSMHGPCDTLHPAKPFPGTDMDLTTPYLLQCPPWGTHGPHDTSSTATPFLGLTRTNDTHDRTHRDPVTPIPEASPALSPRVTGDARQDALTARPAHGPAAGRAPGAPGPGPGSGPCPPGPGA